MTDSNNGKGPGRGMVTPIIYHNLNFDEWPVFNPDEWSDFLCTCCSPGAVCSITSSEGVTEIVTVTSIEPIDENSEYTTKCTPESETNLMIAAEIIVSGVTKGMRELELCSGEALEYTEEEMEDNQKAFDELNVHAENYGVDINGIPFDPITEHSNHYGYGDLSGNVPDDDFKEDSIND